MKLDLQGWHSKQPIFEQLLRKVRPKIVFELGTWKGASVIHMAQTARRLDLDTRFFAVDFWSADVVIEGDHGLREQFDFNVRAMGVENQIIPLQMSTAAAAVHLGAGGVFADLIYVDADHTYEGCLSDLENFYPLLNKRGVMFGDDVTEIPSVREAVEEFCRRHDLYYRADYYHWQLQPKIA